ncbi:uncharacterized protein LOC129915995 [Episyrphus balteatus]|uniref:uncharacterized protein LOC129915995 n=1 Tax=Episyrphus balteatus TaxID=286459 RepID=UPI00248590CB|nr:uncharacterized protein LOC129915995 [Episyrphus balteatus]
MDKTKGQISTRHGVVKQGVLWQQSDKLFSKWKERYFILTRDHLCCLKKGEGGFICGETLSKIKLEDIKSLEFITRITQQTIEMTLGGGSGNGGYGENHRILLKTNGDLREWFDILNACCNIAKQRRNPQSHYIEAIKARGRNLRREKTEIRQSSSSCHSDGLKFINLSDHLPRFSFRRTSTSLQKRPRSNSACPYGPLADIDSLTINGFALRKPGGSLRSKLRNYDKIYRNYDSATDKEDDDHELSENVCYRMSRLQS